MTKKNFMPEAVRVSSIWGKEMTNRDLNRYYKILERELRPALGCTEPGAVGLAAAKAAEVLGCFPAHIDMYCSANIIKNVKSVNVPNSKGMKGIAAAAALAVVAGDPEDALEIFKSANDAAIAKAKELLEQGFCATYLQKGEGNLFIRAVASCGENMASVTIKDTHTNIVEIKKNDAVLFENHGSSPGSSEEDFDDFSTVREIMEFADAADWQRLKSLMETQVRVNTAIAEEGLSGTYSSSVGKTLLEAYDNDIKIRARAKAAAGSDARMGGSPMPVVINSGSGNQGITLTVPVVEYAGELAAGEEKMYRALAIANLISIHIKKHIGKLSAFCGAVSAACGAGAAITYMSGGTYAEICSTVSNTLANVGGIVCDGAKSSCAAKIASSIDAAIMAHEMSIRHSFFPASDGIVGADIEETIDNFGTVGREGMLDTDICIMRIMLGC